MDHERATTPPGQITRSSTTASKPPLTPEIKRRIEENRLKAKAIRDQREAAARASGHSTAPNTTPSGFLAATSDNSLAGRKRAHETIARQNIPDTQRDARNSPGGQDGEIRAARKFRKYVDHDFSKMTDTKGGFLTAEDDPFNKALHSGLGKDGKEERPAHMTLKEWERHQLLKDLKRRKEGMYEPGLSVMGEATKKCRECGSLEIDWVWEEVFGCAVCHKCKEAKPEMYSLLTKTECRDDYLLTEPELKDEELLPHLNKPNPHKSHWHDMMLFLRYQVEAYAFGPKKWGSPEALDAEFQRREAEKKKRKEQKFKTKLQELKKKTRTEHYRRQREGGGPAGFGEKVGGGRHEHEWGRTVENAEGVTIKKCTECGMEVEELEF